VIRVAFALLTCALVAGSAWAADYPTRPIRLLIGFPPGAGMDAVARPFAARLSELLGQPVLVENRPGAGGAVSSAALARAPADGYTLGLGANGDLVIVPQLIKVDYDPLASFSPISLLSREDGFVLLAHPSFPPNTLQELVSLAREKPGSVSFGSGGVGLPHHIAMEQFKIVANVNMVHIPYKGAGPMTSDIVGGQLMLGIGNVTALPLIRAGKVKAIAVTASRRIAALPEVPTFSEQGYPGVEASGWFALIGPPNLPPSVIEALNAATRKVSAEPAFNERLFGLGMRGEAGSPAALQQLIRDDTAKWSKLIKDTGVKVE
jgi:tripartite-type tricarboxylate transporter receptor subunit TctC